MPAYVKKENLNRIGKTLHYSLYVITHPLDGFWDLTHEKRGSIAAANIIIFLSLLTTILSYQFTSHMFGYVQLQYYNIFQVIAGFLAPILIGTLSNWGLTTLFDGKGTMKQIYMAIGYALTPYVLINFPIIFISNVMTIEEGAFLGYAQSIASIWVGMLIISAVMQIHDYTLTKTILTLIATAVGMLVIVFVFLLFFSLITDAAAYFISLYKEITYRFY
jgi:hypothetical protein